MSEPRASLTPRLGPVRHPTRSLSAGRNGAGSPGGRLLAGLSGLLPMECEPARSIHEGLASRPNAARRLRWRLEEIRVVLGCGDQNRTGAAWAAASRNGA